MPASEYITQIFIKINRTDAPEEFMGALVEVVVDTSLHLPDMFTIRVRDPELQWADDSRLDIGKSVEIRVQTGQEQQDGLEGTLIKGEITALEPYFSSEGRTTVLIRGYDKSHRLHRGKQIRTFLRVSDSDLASRIAREVELTTEIDSTNIVYDYVLQNNQTNMEFLMTRAERIGYQVYVTDEKLYFKRGEASQSGGPELTFGENLESFRPCLTASHQADEMIVKGWDAKAKQTITGQATPNSNLNQGGMTQTGGDTARTAFSAAKAVVVDQPVFTVDEANALASGLSNDISREFVQAEGECQGDPRVKAGWKIAIRNVGQRFSGEYFITSATHVYNESGYKTTFSITGRQPNTLSHLLETGNGHNQGRGQVPGVATAMVTNLNDPDNLGRVKVKYPWLGDDIESDWVRIVSPMGGKERGFFYLPEVNDEVLVAFEQSNVHHPYILGALWSNEDKPPKPNNEVVGSGKVNQRILKSRSGHLIILDDSDGQEKITIFDKTEKNGIEIDSQQNSMTIKVDGDFTVEARGKITLKSTQDMSFESQANGNLKTQANLTVEATGNGKVKGTQLTLEGTAAGTLKAPTVSVQGQALAEVKGTLVKIN